MGVNFRTDDGLVHAQREPRSIGNFDLTLCGQRLVTNPTWTVYTTETKGVACSARVTCLLCLAGVTLDR